MRNIILVSEMTYRNVFMYSSVIRYLRGVKVNIYLLKDHLHIRNLNKLCLILTCIRIEIDLGKEFDRFEAVIVDYA